MNRATRAGLRILLTLGLLAGVLWVSDGRAALTRLGDADPLWLIVAALLLSVQTVAMAARWWLCARALGVGLRPGAAVGEYYLAQIVNLTLPGGVVGDVARAVRSRGESGLLRAAEAVMIERLAGQIAMFAVACLGFGIALVAPGGIVWPTFTGAALVTVAGAALAAALGLRIMARNDFVGAPARFARSLSRTLRSSRQRRAQIALGLGIALLNLGAFAAAARATGTVMGIEAIVTVVPLILTAMLIPLSVGGWGWREGAAAALFPLLGAPAEAGVAASLAFGLVMTAASLPGALWPMLARRRLPHDTARSRS